MNVPFFKHSLGYEEKVSILEALDSEFLTTGKYVYDFEKAFSEYTHINHTVGLTSCTAALHLGLLACGVGPGDEVITTPQTFVATSLAILHCGATPVWVDVDAATGNINEDNITSKITKKTKAILPVHLYGQMCDMKKIRSIADQHGLSIIEDAAHALSASRDGVRVGQLADVTCFSFYATKSITCGDGGAACTNNENIANNIKSLRSHGLSSDAASRHVGKYKHWDLLEVGYKCNMDNIKAAILLPQINKASKLRDERAHRFLYYRSHIKNIGIDFPKVLDAQNEYHLFTIWVDPQKRDSILWKLQDAGIGVAVNYKSINLLSKFKDMYHLGEGNFPNSEKIGSSTISLPLYPSLNFDQIDFVCDTLNKLV